MIGFAAAVRLYLQVLVEGGIDSVGLREVAARPAFAREVAPGLVAIRVAVAVLLIGVTTAAALAFLPELEGRVLALYSLTLIPLALNTRWIHLGIGRGDWPAVARIVGELGMVATVLLVVRGPDDITRVPLAQLGGDLAAAVILAALLGRIGAGPLVEPSRWRLGWPVLVKAAPLGAHALLGLVMFNADFLFLRAFHGRAELGYYAAAYALVSFLLNLGVTYYQSLLPVFATHQVPAGRQRAFDDALVVVATFGVPLAVGGGFLAGPIITRFFGAEFGQAGVALAILVASIPFALIRNVTQAAQVAAKREDLVLRSSLVGAISCLTLNAILIPPFGIVGAATATLSTEIVRTAYSAFLARRVGYEIDGLRPWLRPVIAAGFMAAMLRWVGPGGFELAVVGGVTYYFATLWVIGGGGRLTAAIRGSRSTELAP